MVGRGGQSVAFSDTTCPSTFSSFRSAESCPKLLQSQHECVCMIDSDRSAAVGVDNLLVSRCEQSGGGAVASQVHNDSDTLYHCEGRRVPSLTNANHTPAAFYIITGSPPAHRQPLLWAWPTRDTA